MVNPRASAVNRRVVGLVAQGLRTRFALEVEVTDAKGHASEIAAAAHTAGFDGVIALGGDGTANEVANGIGALDLPLICLPAGSANVFCGVLGMPRDLPSATRALLNRADSWQTRRIDAGRVNGRRFLFNSGVGLDASVVAGVDARPDLKARWRQWWFVAQAGRTLSGEYAINPQRLRFDAPGERIDGIAAIVQNGRPWTYFGSRPVSVARNAAVTNGSLITSVVGRPRPWDFASLGWRVLSGKGADGHSRVRTVESAAFEISAIGSEPIALHVDGDPIGDADVARYEVEPGGLTVLV